MVTRFATPLAPQPTPWTIANILHPPTSRAEVQAFRRGAGWAWQLSAGHWLHDSHTGLLRHCQDLQAYRHSGAAQNRRKENCPTNRKPQKTLKTGELPNLKCVSESTDAVEKVALDGRSRLLADRKYFSFRSRSLIEPLIAPIFWKK